MGIRFFKIVGAFSYLCAFLALAGAIIIAAMAGTQFFAGVDEDIQKPVVTVDGFQQHQKAVNSGEPETSKRPARDEGETPEEDREYYDKLQPLLSKLITLLNNYATATGQDGVDPDGFEKFLLSQTNEMDRDQYLAFLADFAKEAEALKAKVNQTIAATPDDPRHIEWVNFLNWYVKTYMEQHSAELQRIEKEKLEQAAKRMQAYVMLGIAGGAFLTFVFFTMILLLVRIEANTRASQEQGLAANATGEAAQQAQGRSAEVLGKIEANTRMTALLLKPRATPSTTPPRPQPPSAPKT